MGRVRRRRASTSEPSWLTAAIPGFRAWELRRDGRLVAASAGREWGPGVNVADCGRGAGHAAPAADCSCGLYAFHTVHRQLADHTVIGGIGAWGDIEVHRDGFRAGRARILALGGHRGAPRETLELAAERYGVAIVPRRLLQPIVALQTGLLPVGATAVGPAEEPVWIARRRGYDPYSQTWAEPSGGLVTLGIGGALRGWLGDELRVEAASGDRVRAHDALRLTGSAARVTIPLGVAGVVAEINAAPRMPQGDEADPDGGAWLVRLRPSAWPVDCAGFDWGPAGRAAMEGLARRDGTLAFAHLVAEGELRRDAVTSWGDVLRVLRAQRDEQVPAGFADAGAIYDELGIELGRALERDLAGRRHLEGLRARIALETREPEARLCFDFRDRPAALHCGGDAHADITVRVAADDLPALLAGRLDIARETRTGRVEVAGPRGAALTGLAALVRWSAGHARARPAATAER